MNDENQSPIKRPETVTIVTWFIIIQGIFFVILASYNFCELCLTILKPRDKILLDNAYNFLFYELSRLIFFSLLGILNILLGYRLLKGKKTRISIVMFFECFFLYSFLRNIFYDLSLITEIIISVLIILVFLVFSTFILFVLLFNKKAKEFFNLSEYKENFNMTPSELNQTNTKKIKATTIIAWLLIVQGLFLTIPSLYNLCYDEWNEFLGLPYKNYNFNKDFFIPFLVGILYIFLGNNILKGKRSGKMVVLFSQCIHAYFLFKVIIDEISLPEDMTLFLKYIFLLVLNLIVMILLLFNKEVTQFFKKSENYDYFNTNLETSKNNIENSELLKKISLILLGLSIYLLLDSAYNIYDIISYKYYFPSLKIILTHLSLFFSDLLNIFLNDFILLTYLFLFFFGLLNIFLSHFINNEKKLRIKIILFFEIICIMMCYMLFLRIENNNENNIISLLISLFIYILVCILQPIFINANIKEKIVWIVSILGLYLFTKSIYKIYQIILHNFYYSLDMFFLFLCLLIFGLLNFFLGHSIIEGKKLRRKFFLFFEIISFSIFYILVSNIGDNSLLLLLCISFLVYILSMILISSNTKELIGCIMISSAIPIVLSLIDNMKPIILSLIDNVEYFSDSSPSDILWIFIYLFGLLNIFLGYIVINGKELKRKFIILFELICLFFYTLFLEYIDLSPLILYLFISIFSIIIFDSNKNDSDENKVKRPKIVTLTAITVMIIGLTITLRIFNFLYLFNFLEYSTSYMAIFILLLYVFQGIEILRGENWVRIFVIVLGFFTLGFITLLEIFMLVFLQQNSFLILSLISILLHLFTLWVLLFNKKAKEFFKN
ncbi:MAG: hypothetical protein QXS41_00375 [Candidatus Woesearchaeota archaeon]